MSPEEEWGSVVELLPSTFKNLNSVSNHTKSNKTSKNQGTGWVCSSMPVITATGRWWQEAWRPPWATWKLASNKQKTKEKIFLCINTLEVYDWIFNIVFIWKNISYYCNEFKGTGINHASSIDKQNIGKLRKMTNSLNFTTQSIIDLTCSTSPPPYVTKSWTIWITEQKSTTIN